ncbi:MAG TPA: universal stress protein [Candidatus Dormibacteraeota bacterium]
MTFERLVLAVDGSAHSRKAVPIAIELATPFHGEVFVLHVAERIRGHAGATSSPEADELVAGVVEELQKAGVKARGEVHTVAMGHAAADIVETGKAQGAGVIVMGSRGLSDLAGMLLGSVAHKVIHLAHSPVLIVR